MTTELRAREAGSIFRAIRGRADHPSIREEVRECLSMWFAVQEPSSFSDVRFCTRASTTTTTTNREVVVTLSIQTYEQTLEQHHVTRTGSGVAYYTGEQNEEREGMAFEDCLVDAIRNVRRMMTTLDMGEHWLRQVVRTLKLRLERVTFDLRNMEVQDADDLPNVGEQKEVVRALCTGLTKEGIPIDHDRVTFDAVSELQGLLFDSPVS